MPGATRQTAACLATPSSISRDLRTPSPRLSAVRDQAIGHTMLPVSPLYLPTADGELSKICGSLVEPEDQRQRWACHGCKAIFPRDATIYLAPSALTATTTTTTTTTKEPLQDAALSSLNRRLAATANKSQEHYCKSCYAERFALGSCFACSRPVLGSTKEDGKYVKSGVDGHVWHGRCWRCSQCDAVGGEHGICLGMDGTPTCAECFDRPRVRRHPIGAGVAPGPAKLAGRPPSPFKDTSRRRVSPPTASLSGKATRQGMGAAIAELSRRFGQPVPSSSEGRQSPSKTTSPVLPQLSGRQSPVRGGLTRSNSITAGARPLTAQFSGQGFNLAAFQPSTPAMGRSDSRSRSASPTKGLREDDVCAKCLKGPFEGPLRGGGGHGTNEVRMISLQSREAGGQSYHAECFCCAVCEKSLENAARSFVRLDDGAFAHPNCAPPATIVRQHQPSSPARPASIASSTSSNDFSHATHQRLPRPTLDGDKVQHTLPASYLMGSVGKSGVNPTKTDDGSSLRAEAPQSTSASHSNSLASSIRRFQPTSGAAPPTRSTLLHPSRSSTQPRGPSFVNASMAVSSAARSNVASGDRLTKLGGMQSCGGCNVTVSSLEGIPGPRGQTWHKKCLVCSALPVVVDVGIVSANRRFGNGSMKRCNKQLDSSAKVTAEGELRCRDCYDRERARHMVA